MRACVVNARFAGMRTTGVQRSAHEIVSRLIRNDEEAFQLVSPRLDGDATIPLPVEQRGNIRRGHPWEQLELPRIVRDAGKDTILYSPANTGPLTVNRQVLTVHDLFAVEHPEWYSRAFGTWYRFLWPRLLRKVARVVTNSSYTRERVLDRYGLPEERVVVCRFAQSELFSVRPAGEVARFRAYRRLPERYVLCVGSLEPRKNLTTLANAWKRTSARQEGAELVVAGGAGRKDVFNASASGADALPDPTIRYLGYVPDQDLPLLYGGAEAFALPSLAEGFGLPVLEAMACGTPVVCSDGTALPEVAGGAARLVPALEVEAWTEAIDSILYDSNLRRRMSDAGTRHAQGFSWSRTANAVRSVLDSVS